MAVDFRPAKSHDGLVGTDGQRARGKRALDVDNRRRGAFNGRLQGGT